MPLDQLHQQTLKDWMRSKVIVQCPACGGDRWRFAKAAYIRALLEAATLTLLRTGGGEDLL